MTIVCLVMIVKNEAALIAGTLTHLRPFVDYAVMCDTGSTDDTPLIIQTVCDRLELPVVICHHEWKDFGHNRSLAFASAYDAVPEADWYMVFDADDRIVGDFPDHTLRTIPKDVGALYCTYGTEFLRYQRLTFFRKTLKWGYRGVLHEFACCLSKPDAEVRKQDLGEGYYIHINSRGVSGRSRDPEKFVRDAEILVRAIDDPSTETDLLSRYIFYAARSFMDAGQYKDAIRYFDRYLEDRSRWYEERYDSRMCKARCMLALLQTDPTAYSESDIRDAFVLASTEDPERAEPWYELARWYRVHHADFHLAYAFAKTGFSWVRQIPTRFLFLDREVYTYRLMDELAIAAYWTDRVHECRELCTILLSRAELPEEDRTRIQKNLGYC
jgi:glycosyltransferase involved in cell wall biosynthesis